MREPLESFKDGEGSGVRRENILPILSWSGERRLCPRDEEQGLDRNRVESVQTREKPGQRGTYTTPQPEVPDTLRKVESERGVLVFKSLRCTESHYRSNGL